MNMVMTPVLIAALNSVYRLLTVVVLFPFIPHIEKLVFLLVRDSEEDMEEQADFDLLEERFLQYPDLAISQCHKAMNGMARTTEKNLARSFTMLRDYSDSALEKVEKKEKLLDKYEDKVGTYLMQMTKQPMNSAEIRQTSKFLHTITDFERMGDHAVNIAYVSQRMMEEKTNFTKSGRKEMAVISEAVEELIHMTCQAFQADDVDQALKVEPLCDVIGSLCTDVRSNHVKRLQKGQCGIEQGIVFHDLINNFERIAAHCSNIAIAVVESDAATFDPHAYLQDVKKHKNQAYLDTTQEYEEKFNLDSIQAKDAVEETDKKDNKADKADKSDKKNRDLVDKDKSDKKKKKAKDK
jgi:phosphate:Na+ symporter